MNYLKIIVRKLNYFIFHKQRLFYGGKKVALFSPIRVEGHEYISIGDLTSVQANSWLYAKGISNKPSLKIGSNCVIGYNNHITAIQDVTIEDFVLTANNVYISDNLHSFENIETPIVQQEVIFKNKVKIGFGSWIGENVCVIGASIGRNCVIGANSVVTSDIPDYCVAVGAPAKIIKCYNHHLKKWEKVNTKL